MSPAPDNPQRQTITKQQINSKSSLSYFRSISTIKGDSSNQLFDVNIGLSADDKKLYKRIINNYFFYFELTGAFFTHFRAKLTFSRYAACTYMRLIEPFRHSYYNGYILKIGALISAKRHSLNHRLN
jgi:hypothetical protein